VSLTCVLPFEDKRFLRQLRQSHPSQRQCGCDFSSFGNLAKFVAIQQQ
jgi:hypothetical protein